MGDVLKFGPFKKGRGRERQSLGLGQEEQQDIAEATSKASAQRILEAAENIQNLTAEAAKKMIRDKRTSHMLHYTAEELGSYYRPYNHTKLELLKENEQIALVAAAEAYEQLSDRKKK